jgi:signal recognition particle receptor subunit beta
MVQINHELREIGLKVVYYGPALSGKTTNLHALFDKIDPKARGRLMVLDTKQDRTLFFDMMPVFFRTQSGTKVKLKLYTVPGQVVHESTRRIILQGCDAVVFVADARRSEAPAVAAYWSNLQKNLEVNGIDPAKIPIVVQLNKSDLPDVRREDEVTDLRWQTRPTIVSASAVSGVGVVETFHAVLSHCYRSLNERVDLKKWGMDEQAFIGHLLANIDLTGTAVATSAGGG